MSDKAATPLFDLKTLEAVHQYFEFQAKTDTEMDHWLHEQILRAQHGRDLTPEEVKAHLDF